MLSFFKKEIFRIDLGNLQLSTSTILGEFSKKMEKAPSSTHTVTESTSEEDVDNLIRITKKVKTSGQEIRCDHDKIEEEDGHFEESRKPSYGDKVIGLDSDMDIEGWDLDPDGDAFDDDEWVDDGGPWFSVDMTKEEKKEARKP